MRLGGNGFNSETSEVVWQGQSHHTSLAYVETVRSTMATAFRIVEIHRNMSKKHSGTLVPSSFSDEYENLSEN